MAEETTSFYRAFPKYFNHPKLYRQIEKTEFEPVSKRQIEGRANGLCPGHQKTLIYFVESEEERNYIVEVVLDGATFYIETPCTFYPSQGMDTLDGNLAQDAEEWVLSQNLGYTPKRLQFIFGDNDKIYFNDYLKIVGLPHSEKESDSLSVNTQKGSGKQWWKFW